MGELRAIETRYAGCRFRSRLEARWALAFDWLGVPWEYEGQGYILESSSAYLPDFHLPSCDLYVEVKGSSKLLERDARRINEFAAGGQNVVILGSVPHVDPDVYPIHLGSGAAGLFDAYFTGSRHASEQVEIMASSQTVANLNQRFRPESAPVEVQRAYLVAREARFERGESPARPTLSDRNSPPPPELKLPSRRHSYVFVRGRWVYAPTGQNSIPEWRRGENQRERDLQKGKPVRQPVKRSQSSADRASRRTGSSPERVHVSLDGDTTICRLSGASIHGVALGPASRADWFSQVTCFNCSYRLAKAGLWDGDSIPGKPSPEGSRRRHAVPVVEAGYRYRLPGIANLGQL
ncbi:hypothetical protein GCM10009836_20330 [Pseudonocardia ailaonensis]|uniref:Restriction endonuclease n=1 Tax=Pseudonocardia ailaonensis TaxID=367279 RepID=A0ABN2MVU2_9PSEU